MNENEINENEKKKEKRNSHNTIKIGGGVMGAAGRNSALSLLSKFK